MINKAIVVEKVGYIFIVVTSKFQVKKRENGGRLLRD
jgi:hypothetical protein